jgi:PTH1 family peptidyl-tRNA hydrolase
MNRSGWAVRLLLQASELAPAGMLVIHDDLDLPFGRLRVRTAGGHGGHNGLRSILESLGTGEFLRLKVGIGRPAEGADPVEHVLSPFDANEEAELPRVLDRAADAAECILLEGPPRAMNLFNA